MGGAPGLARFRANFPAAEAVAYFNAGSVGPLPRASAEAAREVIEEQLTIGRASAQAFEKAGHAADALRARISGVMGCRPGEIALTGSTTDGLNTVIGGLELGAGDEVVTSDEEHPGLLARLGYEQRYRGVSVRSVPIDQVAVSVGPRTRLVAASHVSWQSGRVIDTDALAGLGVPVLLDGAQGLGVAAVDVRELGCTFYAAAGQKWLCGPIGCGYLYVSDDYIDRLRPTWPSFGTLADPVNPLTSEPRPGAARFDSSFPAAERTAAALAALQVLEAAGLSAVHERSIALAGELAARLSDLDMRVVSRGASSLVSWFSDAPRAESERLLGLGFLVRYLPGTQLIRASVGAWNTPEEIAGLASAAAQAQSEGT